MTSKAKVLLVNEFHGETIAELDRMYDTLKLWEVPASEKEQFISSIDGEIEAAASASWICDPRIYDINSLELIACFGVGVDGIDFGACSRNNIRVSNTPGVLDDAVADLAMALILVLTRDICNADAFCRDRQWQDGPFALGTGIQGKTIGILGMGRIGKATAARIEAFGAKISYHNRRRTDVEYDYYDSIESLAKASDILVNLLPGGEDTRSIVDSTIFDALGPESYFVNVGRGSSVNEGDMISALREGRIAGAGLDVYSNEPYIPEELLRMRNVLLLPHIGSATTETRRAMGQLVCKNLAEYFKNNSLITEYFY